MKPHIKVIQRNGVDIFVTSSLKYKLSVSQKITAKGLAGMGASCNGLGWGQLINTNYGLRGAL